MSIKVAIIISKKFIKYFKRMDYYSSCYIFLLDAEKGYDLFLNALVAIIIANEIWKLNNPLIIKIKKITEEN